MLVPLPCTARTRGISAAATVSGSSASALKKRRAPGVLSRSSKSVSSMPASWGGGEGERERVSHRTADRWHSQPSPITASHPHPPGDRLCTPTLVTPDSASSAASVSVSWLSARLVALCVTADLVNWVWLVGGSREEGESGGQAPGDAVSVDAQGCAAPPNTSHPPNLPIPWPPRARSRN